MRELASFEANEIEEEQCLLWMWLVLISSLLIANTKKSTMGMEMALQLVRRYPTCQRWDNVEKVLNDFFASDVVMESLRSHWHALKVVDLEFVKARASPAS